MMSETIRFTIEIPKWKVSALKVKHQINTISIGPRAGSTLHNIHLFVCVFPLPLTSPSSKEEINLNP